MRFSILTPFELENASGPYFCAGTRPCRRIHKVSEQARRQGEPTLNARPRPLVLKPPSMPFTEIITEQQAFCSCRLRLSSGGQVVLKPVAVPEMQFTRVDGASDALYAMELALQVVYRVRAPGKGGSADPLQYPCSLLGQPPFHSTLYPNLSDPSFLHSMRFGTPGVGTTESRSPPAQLEKFVYGKLKQLHKLGAEANDAQFCDEIEKYLGDQVPSPLRLLPAFLSRFLSAVFGFLSRPSVSYRVLRFPIAPQMPREFSRCGFISLPESPRVFLDTRSGFLLAVFGCSSRSSRSPPRKLSTAAASRGTEPGSASPRALAAPLPPLNAGRRARPGGGAPAPRC